MKQNTKGQAALEFLSTYGFAFLIILVMIGALAYFGVLNPQNFLPERCTFGSEMACVDYQVTPDDVSIQMRNQGGEPVRIYSVFMSATGEDGLTLAAANVTSVCVFTDNQGATFTPGTGAPLIGQGSSFTASGCDVANILPSGRQRIDMEIRYRTAQGTFDRSVRGQIFASVIS